MRCVGRNFYSLPVASVSFPVSEGKPCLDSFVPVDQVLPGFVWHGWLWHSAASTSETDSWPCQTNPDGNNPLIPDTAEGRKASRNLWAAQAACTELQLKWGCFTEPLAEVVPGQEEKLASGPA